MRRMTTALMLCGGLALQTAGALAEDAPATTPTRSPADKSARLAAPAEAGRRPDPANPAAPIPVVKPEPALSGYRPYQPQPVAPWKQVLDEVVGVPGAAGYSATDANAQAGPSGGMAMKPGEAGHAGHDMASMVKQSPPGPGAAAPRQPAGSDATGVVQSINAAERKVKVKHGPIAKLDMPGMTMVFRVSDPKLLDQVREGEQVGFTVERGAAGGFVITGFQKP